MGSLGGHVLPGTFFGLFAIWWIYSVLKRFHLCRRAAVTAAGGGPGAGNDGGGRSLYRNTTSFPCPCFSRLPLEGIFIVTFIIIGIVGEFVTAYEHGKFTHLNNAQHMTMYFFFGLTGVMDILSHYRVPMPPSLNYVSACLAFCMEGLLFLYHLHGRTPMDVQVHMLLLWVIGGCILSVLAEMYFKRSVLPALARCYFILLQGTWFYQAGFILYPPGGPKWDEEDQDQMMIVTLIFCWHNALVFVFIMLMNWIVYVRTRVLSTTAIYHSLRPITASPEAIRRFTKMDKEQVRSIIADSEEEVV